MKNIFHNFQWDLKSRGGEIIYIEREGLEFSSFPLAISLNIQNKRMTKK